MSEQVDQKQRMLKIVVIVLGILILIALGIIAVGLATTAAKLGKEKPRPAAAQHVSGAAAPAAAADIAVALPKGAQVVSVTGEGGEFYVLLDTAAGRRLLIVDRASGKVTGSVRFEPAAGS